MPGLQGLPLTSPIPVRARQFAPASGSSVGSFNLRPVVLVGNMLASGTETVETLGGPIQSLTDCITRFGQRSEITWMYRAYTLVDQVPLIYAVAMAEGGGASASTCNFVFQTPASVATAIDIYSVKGLLQVQVSLNDSVQTQATNAAAAINADPDLPFSAAVDTTATTIAVGSNGQALPQASISVASTTGLPTAGTVLIGGINAVVQYTGTSGGNTLMGCTVVSGSGTLSTGQTVTNQGQLNITTFNKGPRSAYWINQLRMSMDNPANATTITKSSVTAGTTADNCANAITAIDTSTFTYHAIACTSTASVTSNDGGVGQYSAYIASIVAPVGNKSSMFIFAVDGTSSQAASVTQSAAVNSTWGKCYRVYTNDWHPAMISALHAAVHRSQEVNYAAYNFAGYTTDSNKGTVYPIPDPFNKANRPTVTQMTTDLNAGVSTVGFRTDGTAYIVRSITAYSWIGSSTTNDYRAREGHIPSVLFKFWEDLSAQLLAQWQPNVAADPPQGAKAVPGFMYRSTVRSICNSLIASMCGAYQGTPPMALLDPSVLTTMQQSTQVQLLTAGFQLDAAIACVRHNLQDLALIAEIGAAY